MIEQQDIQNILSGLNPDYAAFVSSPFANEAASQLGNKNGFDMNKTTQLKDGFVLYLLLVIDQTELQQFVVEKCQVNHEESFKIVNAFLSALPPQIVEAQNAAYIELENRNIETAAHANINQTTKTYNSPESQPESHIRTMASDMRQARQEDGTFVSTSQDSLLQKKENASGDEARWGRV